jgi:hypothetical protein
MRRKTMSKPIGFIFIFIAFCSIAFGCQAKSSDYLWSEITSRAAFPQGYNYPVFVLNSEMFALNNGGWISKDGKNWTKTALTESGLNSAYQKYVQFKDAVYALGTMQGNYLNMQLSSRISRTRDFRTWETLAEKSNLPERVFYGAVSFKGKIWLIGGWDGKNYYNDVWNSEDGVNWQRVAQKTAWTPRTARVVVVFQGRIWLFGGSVIDGEKTTNPKSGEEVWSSADGVDWTRVEINSPRPVGGTPVVFDDKLWMVGANRNTGNFGSAVFVSDDGLNWQEQAAPWSPRGAVAVWVVGDKLYMTGGKYSFAENGEIKFVYSNDVWAMSRKTE